MEYTTWLLQTTTMAAINRTLSFTNGAQTSLKSSRLFQPCNGASGLKFFTIEGEHYLAVAENYDGSTSSIDSSVYKWQQGRFVKYQNIPTDGTEACDSIVIANETFLVYANHYHCQKKYEVDSSVYKWPGGHFVKFQSVKT